MQVSQELWATFAFYVALLMAKFLVMSLLTARQRFGKSAFANPEDVPLLKGSKVFFGDPDVERIRRAHMNDIENILPFVLLAAIYLTTAPSVGTAKLLFRVFTAARYIHTFVYLFAVPQPSRALAFFVGMGVNFYMIYAIVATFA